jgi:hypothetical protein
LAIIGQAHRSDEAADPQLDVVASSAPLRAHALTGARGGASHGLCWHRPAQEGKPDLHPLRGWPVERMPDPHRAPAVRRGTGRPAAGGESCSRRRRRPSGWPGPRRGWATRSWSPTRTSRRCTSRGPGRSRPIGGMPGRWPRPACSGRTARRIGSRRRRGMCGDAWRRDAVVRTRTRYIALIRALLRRHGWRVPTGSAETFSRRVMALRLPGRLLHRQSALGGARPDRPRPRALGLARLARPARIRVSSGTRAPEPP